MSKRIAIIDPKQNNKLIGYEKISNARWKKSETKIPVPEDCDLDPKVGYRWDKELETFVPLKKKLNELPNFSFRAIAEGLIAVRDQTNVQFPPSTLKFLEIWERQIGEEGE